MRDAEALLDLGKECAVRGRDPWIDGLGFVEVSLGAVFVGFGIPGATAAAAVLVFRVFELWLPVVIGGALSHRLRVVDQ